MDHRIFTLTYELNPNLRHLSFPIIARTDPRARMLEMTTTTTVDVEATVEKVTESGEVMRGMGKVESEGAGGGGSRGSSHSSGTIEDFIWLLRLL